MDNKLTTVTKQTLTQEEINTLVGSGIIPQGTPPSTIKLFAKVCAEKRLSPFSNQIHLIKRGDKFTIQTGIDGLRTIAYRTGLYAGADDCLYDEGLTKYQMIEKKRPKPTTATMTIYKLIEGQKVPFTASAVFSEYFPTNEKLSFLWNKMPYLMISKTVESLTLRKAFPDELSGVYAEEEMHQAEEITIEEDKKDNPYFQIRNAQTIDEIKKIWNANKPLQKDKEFIKAGEERKKELTPVAKAEAEQEEKELDEIIGVDPYQVCLKKLTDCITPNQTVAEYQTILKTDAYKQLTVEQKKLFEKDKEKFLKTFEVEDAEYEEVKEDKENPELFNKPKK